VFNLPVKITPKIIADTRESSFVINHLQRLGVQISLEMISPGYYVVADGFAVERKTFDDFLRSIFDKRLFEQVERLRGAYPRCCLLVEGDVDYGLGNLKNPLVFWGALAKIIADQAIPIVFTMNEKQSAEFLLSLAKKSQEKKEKLMARYKPKMYSLADRQLLAVQGLPNVGPKIADRLLRRFGTVRKVFTAHPIELRGVSGMGRKKENAISRFLDSQFLVSVKCEE
jgi:ERCC4-type nuclease